MKMQDKPTQDSQDTSFVTCYNCKKPEHVLRDCYENDWMLAVADAGADEGERATYQRYARQTNHYQNIAFDETRQKH